MTRSDLISSLRHQRSCIVERFGVRRLGLFGSMARDEAGPGSDVDVLVEFDGPADSSRYFGLQFFLEDLLGCPVDLVTHKALRSELRPYVERDLIDV